MVGGGENEDHPSKTHLDQFQRINFTDCIALCLLLIRLKHLFPSMHGTTNLCKNVPVVVVQNSLGFTYLRS